MRSAEAWAKECHDKGHDPLGQFTLVHPVICLDCARAYARECVEAWRERALLEIWGYALNTERMLAGDATATLRHNIVAALRALPGETP